MRKHINKVRSSQPAILVLNWTKNSFSLWVSSKRNSLPELFCAKAVLKNPTNFTETLRKLYCQIWGLHKNREKCNVFHFRFLPAKSNDKISQKLRKTPFWVPFTHFRKGVFSVTRFFFWKKLVTDVLPTCRSTDIGQAWIHSILRAEGPKKDCIRKYFFQRGFFKTLVGLILYNL